MFHNEVLYHGVLTPVTDNMPQVYLYDIGEEVRPNYNCPSEEDIPPPPPTIDESPVPSGSRKMTPIKARALKWKQLERRPLADITSLPYKKRLTGKFDDLLQEEKTWVTDNEIERNL